MIYVFTLFLLSFSLSVVYRTAPLHPLFWFPVFLALYGSWYYLLLETAGFVVGPQDQLFLECNIIALLAFALPVAALVPKNSFSGIALSPRNFALDKFSGWIYMSILALFMAWVVLSGASSKRAIKGSLNEGMSLIAAMALIGIMIMAVRSIAVRYYCPKPKTLPVLAFLMTAIGVFLVLGEREILFGGGILWFLVSSEKTRRKKVVLYFYALVLAGVFAVAASQGLKAALIGQVNWERVFFESVFYSEFTSPGRNFGILASMGSGDLSGWAVVATEFQRFLFSVVPGENVVSMSEWFNQAYRADLNIDGSSGWGFTLIGSAYLAGGKWGVALFYFFIGLNVSLILRMARCSNIFFISYLCIVPTLIYTTRQDLSYLLNYYFKYALLFNALLSCLAFYLTAGFPKDVSHKD